jgi:hypothetical protein
MTHTRIKRITITLAIVLAVGGLNIPQASAGKAAQQAKELAWMEKSKNTIRVKLKDPQSAKFQNVFFSRASGTPVTCGQVNSKNGFGAYSGYQYFVAAGSDLAFLQNEVVAFAAVWGQLCAK